MQTNKANEGLGRFEFYRPYAPTLLCNELAEFVRVSVAGGFAHTAEHELHDLRIGIHPRKRCVIGIAPLTQKQARGFNSDELGLFHWRRLCNCVVLLSL